MSTRRVRLAFAAVVFTILFAQLLLYPGLDALVAALGAETALDAGMWFLGAEFGAFVVFAVVWGGLSDAVGRRAPLVAAGALAGSLGYLLLAVLPAALSLPFTAVLGLRVLQGAATIGAFSLSMTMLMDLEGGHGRNMGAAGIAIGAGTALGAPVGGQLYEVGPFVPLFAAAALLGVVGLLAALVTDPAPSADREGLAAALVRLRERPALLAPCAFGFVDRFTAGFLALVGTLYFRESFGLSPGTTGLLLALFFGPFALLQYPFGVLSDRVGRFLPMLGGSVCYGLALAAVGQVPTVPAVGALMVLVGVLGALVAPATMALVTDIAVPEGRGTAMAAFNVFGSLGFLAGVFVGGTVADAAGYRAAFLAVGATEVTIALLAVPLLLLSGLPTAVRRVDRDRG